MQDFSESTDDKIFSKTLKQFQKFAGLKVTGECNVSQTKTGTYKGIFYHYTLAENKFSLRFLLKVAVKCAI